MGIDTAAAQLILLARTYPDFHPEQGLIFGHQKNYIGPRLKGQLKRHLGMSKSSLSMAYADAFFESVGLGNIDTLDISNYENANVIQDLNERIPDSLKKYSFVIDIGTLEHVFNVGQGLENIKDFCVPGGYVLMLNPANNWLGHGFYQFSPELLFRNFDSLNGWEVKAMFLVKKSIFRTAWYKVEDPKMRVRRGNLHSKNPTYVGVIARKTHDTNFASNLQQSDYETAWEVPKVSRLGSAYLRLPKIVRSILDVTLMAGVIRYRGRLKRLQLVWKDGQLTVR